MSIETNALKLLCDALRESGVRFAIGGSLASSARGVPRATLDGDVVAAIDLQGGSRLPSKLGDAWYADPVQILEAIRRNRSFHLIHLPSFLKFDIFPAAEDFQRAQLQRATELPVQFPGDSIPCPVITSEDILVVKLLYRDGGEVSERQWSDIQGVLAVNQRLDFAYVNTWAERLGIAAVLERAIRERGAV